MAEYQLNYIYDLINEGKIIIEENRILRLRQNYEKFVEVKGSSFYWQIDNNEEITIYRNHILLVDKYPPANKEKGYTKLDLADFWINKNSNKEFGKLFNQSLEKLFYKNVDNSVCIDQLKMVFWKIISIEKRPLTATIINNRYMGLYNYWQENKEELGDTFMDFCIQTLSIPEEFVDYERSAYFFKKGKRWDQQIKKVFTEHCEGFNAKANSKDENGKEIRPDGLLIDNDICIDFKLSFIQEDKLLKGKELNEYAKKHKAVIVLYLMGPREVIKIDNLTSMNIYDWIKDKKNIGRFQNVDEVVKKVNSIENELEMGLNGEDVLEILEKISRELDKDNISGASIAREVGFKWVAGVLSGRLYANYPLAKEIREKYKKKQNIKQWDKSFYAIDLRGTEYGPFIVYEDCIQEIKKHNPYFEFNPLERHGIERSLSNRSDDNVYKGYAFVYAKELAGFKRDLTHHLTKAEGKLNNNRFKGVILTQDANEKGAIKEFFVSRVECADKLKIDEKAISEAIKSGQPYRGMLFSRFIFKLYTKGEYKINPTLKSQEEYVLSNKHNILKKIKEAKSKDKANKMSEQEINGLMKNILVELNNELSLNQIKKKLSYTGVNFIVTGNRFADHKLSSTIQAKYKDLLNNKTTFYAVNCVGEKLGPFSTNKYKECLDTLKNSDQYFSFFNPNSAGIKKVVYNEEGRSSYYGYCFVKDVEYKEWENNKEEHLLKIRSKSALKLFIKAEVKDGIHKVIEVYKTLDKITNVLGYKNTQSAKKRISENPFVGEFKYMEVSCRLHTEQEKESYRLKGIDIDLLLNQIINLPLN